MSKESDFLLGYAFSLLSRIRSYLILKNDLNGVENIEDDYQTLKSGIEKHFYGKEKNNG